MALIGVLALQGGYSAHARCLEQIGHEYILVRTSEQLAQCDGLVFPGGESTTHLKLIDRFKLEVPLNEFVQSGRPILATCAGLILAAHLVQGGAQRSFDWIDIDVSRNAWGRQVHSFEAILSDANMSTEVTGAPLNLLFIRAPRIQRCGDDVRVLVRYQDEPIAVQQGTRIGLTFHPELKGDARFHRLAFG